MTCLKRDGGSDTGNCADTPNEKMEKQNKMVSSSLIFAIKKAETLKAQRQ
jgi:hypothetical protein